MAASRAVTSSELKSELKAALADWVRRLDNANHNRVHRESGSVLKPRERPASTLMEAHVEVGKSSRARTRARTRCNGPRLCGALARSSRPSGSRVRGAQFAFVISCDRVRTRLLSPRVSRGRRSGGARVSTGRVRSAEHAHSSVSCPRASTRLAEIIERGAVVLTERLCVRPHHVVIQPGTGEDFAAPRGVALATATGLLQSAVDHLGRDLGRGDGAASLPCESELMR